MSSHLSQAERVLTVKKSIHRARRIWRKCSVMIMSPTVSAPRLNSCLAESPLNRLARHHLLVRHRCGRHAVRVHLVTVRFNNLHIRALQ